jgi:hypothetical protein
MEMARKCPDVASLQDLVRRTIGENWTILTKMNKR